MRLIDANKLKKTMLAEIERLYRVGHPYSATVVSDVIEKLDLEPSVDAEPVVHCKDYKFRSETQELIIIEPYCELHERVVKLNSFCSFAKPYQKMGEEKIDNV